MGFGNNSGEWNAVYFLTAKTPKGEEPYFDTTKGVGDGKYEKLEAQKWVEGHLYDILIKEKEFEGKPYKVLVIKLEDDPKQLYWVEFSFNYLGRNLMNRLLEIKEFKGRWRLALYESEPGKGYDRGFPSVSFKVNGEKIPFKHSNEVMNDLIGEVETDDGVVKQFRKLNEFMENELNSGPLALWEKVKNQVRMENEPASPPEPEYDMSGEELAKIRVEGFVVPDQPPPKKVDDDEDDLPF